MTQDRDFDSDLPEVLDGLTESLLHRLDSGSREKGLGPDPEKADVVSLYYKNLPP